MFFLFCLHMKIRFAFLYIAHEIRNTSLSLLLPLLQVLLVNVNKKKSEIYGV